MFLNTAPASCYRLGFKRCVEGLMQLGEFYQTCLLQNSPILRANFKLPRICTAVMWRQKYIYIKRKKEHAFHWQVLHYVMTLVTCTAPKVWFALNAELYSIAEAIISCCVTADVHSTTNSPMLSAWPVGLTAAAGSISHYTTTQLWVGFTVSCPPCPSYIPADSKSHHRLRREI